MSETSILERTDTEIDPTTGEPRVSHIVAKDGLTEAYIKGVPVEALCGHVFVPTRNAKKYPLCSKCKEVRDKYRPDQDPNEIQPA